MGPKTQRALAIASFVASILHFYFWELVRSAIYERLLHAMTPFITADAVAHYGIPLALVALGTWLFCIQDLGHSRRLRCQRQVSRNGQRNTLRSQSSERPSEMKSLSWTDIRIRIVHFTM